MQLPYILQGVQQEKQSLNEGAKVKRVTLEHVEKVSQQGNKYFYEIWLSEALRLQEEAWLELKSARHELKAQVIRLQDNQNPIVQTAEPLKSREIYRIEAIFNPGFILEALYQALTTVDESAERVLSTFLKKKLSSEGIEDPSECPASLNRSQWLATCKALTLPISVIWGPPGTGKTHTLGQIIRRALLKKTSVLVVSTSNVAIDQVLLASRKALINEPTLRQLLYRVGMTDDLFCSEHLVAAESPKIASGSRVVFTTLASLAIHYEKLSAKGFNTVIIDEASMVSMSYAVIAAYLAVKRLVIAGDFCQLPPISLSKHSALSKNPFDHLNIPQSIDEQDQIPALTLLNTQYRMTQGMSDMVSHLFYKGQLRCGVSRQANSKELVFIDMDQTQMSRSFFSVDDSSYYHPTTLFLLGHALADLNKQQDSVMVLTPFRAQQTLLNNFLLDQGYSKGRALTIHRAQGTEKAFVYLDLTTHDETREGAYSQMFTAEQTQNLINVALSRATQRLTLIGSRYMLKQLANQAPYFKQLLDLIDRDFHTLSAAEILDKITIKQEHQLPETSRSMVVIDPFMRKTFLSKLQHNTAEHRYYFSLPNLINTVSDPHGVTFRRLKLNEKIPEMAIFDDVIVMRYQNRYLTLSSKVASKTLSRLSVGHMMEDEAPASKHTLVLNCASCNSNRTPHKRAGVYVLKCMSCHREERITTFVAKQLKAIYKVKCPTCQAETTPRAKAGSGLPSFYACTNYPRCKGATDFSKAFFLGKSW